VPTTKSTSCSTPAARKGLGRSTQNASECAPADDGTASGAFRCCARYRAWRVIAQVSGTIMGACSSVARRPLAGHSVRTAEALRGGGRGAEVDFVVGTFSKSLGAIWWNRISAGRSARRLRIHVHRLLPPAVIASVIAALPAALDGQITRRARFSSNCLPDYYSGLRRGLRPGPEPNPIGAVKMPDRETATQFEARLLDEGIYVNLPCPPQRPASLSLIRQHQLGTQRRRRSIGRLHYDRGGHELGVSARAPSRTAMAAGSRAASADMQHDSRDRSCDRQRLPSDGSSTYPSSSMERQRGGFPSAHGTQAGLLAAGQRVLAPGAGGAILARASQQPAMWGGSARRKIPWRSEAARSRRPFRLPQAIDDRTFSRPSRHVEDFLKSRGVTRALRTLHPVDQRGDGLPSWRFRCTADAAHGALTPLMGAPGSRRWIIARKGRLRLFTRHGGSAFAVGARHCWSAAAGSVTMRRLNLSDYANEIRRMVDIYNDAWSGQLGVRAPDGARGRRDGQATAGALDERWSGLPSGRPSPSPSSSFCRMSMRPFGPRCRLFPSAGRSCCGASSSEGLKSARVPLMGVRRSLAGTMIGSAILCTNRCRPAAKCRVSISLDRAVVGYWRIIYPCAAFSNGSGARA